MDEALRICELLDLLPYIQQLPQGMETMLFSEGKTLSNSIRLKIILARCIAEKPKLLLLEDNLSQLEPGLRSKIVSYLFDKTKSWTIMAISNNTDYLKMMDRVIVLEDGKIIAEGTYEELSENQRVKILLHNEYEK
jgi:ABC-type multidrug transport system fused ATPase/permease subunit